VLFPRFGVATAQPEALFTADLRRRVAEILEKPVEHWLFDRVRAATPTMLRASGEGAEIASDGVSRDTSAGDNDGAADAGVSRPDVSVVVPVYNSAAWIHECLLSILGQSGVSLEVICVNDGSTDDSLRILHEYATSDSRVIVVDQPNGGQSVARNVGLSTARGRYTCLIDSDDYWKVDELSELVEHADRDSLDVLLFDAVSFFEPGISEENYNAYATYYTRTRSYQDVVTGPELIVAMRAARDYRASPCLYLIRTGFLNQAQLRFIPGIMHEDNPFTFALLLEAERVAHEKRPLYARRVRPGSTMTAGTAERSMRGYFASYLDMRRRLSQHAVPAEVGLSIGELVHQIYASSRKLFLELPTEVADRIRDVDQSPDAHCTFLILQYERNLVRKIERMTKSSVVGSRSA
jgi:glycosyltransferase involved in cell wall biosynthesis